MKCSCPKDPLVLVVKTGKMLELTRRPGPMDMDTLAAYRHAAHVAEMCAECMMGASVVCDDMTRKGAGHA